MKYLKREPEIEKYLCRELRSLFERTENINVSESDRLLLEEIRLRVGQPVGIYSSGGKYYVNSDGVLCINPNEGYICRPQMLAETLKLISECSMYAFESQIREGYITVKGGHRIGMCGQAVYSEDKLITLKNISSLNIRVAHELVGISDTIMNRLWLYKTPCNILIISKPGCGKTTLLRDIIRYYSEKGIYMCVIDERSEIASGSKGIPMMRLGPACDVYDGVKKKDGILKCIRTMRPDMVALDEINENSDMKAVMEGMTLGVYFICTMHAASTDDVSRELRKLFDVIIELTGPGKYKVYKSNNTIFFEGDM